MKLKTLFFAVAALIFSAGSALATFDADFAYTYTDNGSNNYTFNVTVTNNSDGSDTAGLDFFQIDLDADSDYSLYSNVTWVTDNGWESGTENYNPAFGTLPGYVWADDGIFGTNNGGLSPGESATFTFSFNYTGSITPDMQLFSWLADFGTHNDPSGPNYDPNLGYGYQAEISGQLRYNGGQQPVPEPSTIILFGLGLAGFLAAGRKDLMRLKR